MTEACDNQSNALQTVEEYVYVREVTDPYGKKYFDVTLKIQDTCTDGKLNEVPIMSFEKEFEAIMLAGKIQNCILSILLKVEQQILDGFKSTFDPMKRPTIITLP